MLLRRSQPPNNKLSDPIKPANRVPGPASPLERDPQSPIGWKNRESDGVGLGIVAALDKLDNWKRLEKIKCASAPIPVGDRRSACGWTRGAEGREDDYVWQSDGGVPFYESPPPKVAGEPDGFRMADFLSCCYLCRKRLNGKDVYMYRGEKAFCSVECRHQQIVSDEFQENCSSEISNSSYSDNSKQLFFTRIIAA